MRYLEILKKLNLLSNPEAISGMVRFGINPHKAYGGISTPTLRAIVKEIGKDHELGVFIASRQEP